MAGRPVCAGWGIADNGPMSAQLYLASRSPRRAQFLEQLGLRFAALPADVPELPTPGQAPAEYALATALAKARAAAQAAPLPLPVLGADTDVSVDGEILGKPRDRADCLAMLARLSGRSHEVCSAVAVIAGGKVETALSVTRVHFGAISAQAAAAYWETGEPADKAGAYAIQGHAARWVRSIEGSYSGVVGLPLYETCELLRRCGVEMPL
jgi:septum formation protein